MGVTCKPYLPKDRSIMTKLENQLKKEQEANKGKKGSKKPAKEES